MAVAGAHRRVAVDRVQVDVAGRPAGRWRVDLVVLRTLGVLVVGGEVRRSLVVVVVVPAVVADAGALLEDDRLDLADGVVIIRVAVLSAEPVTGIDPVDRSWTVNFAVSVIPESFPA